MDMNDIAERMKKIIIKNLGVSSNKVTLEANLIDDLAMDSFDLVELVMAIEEEFDMEIEDATAEKWVTVQGIIDSLERHLLI